MTYTIQPQKYTDIFGVEKTSYLKVWEDGTFEEYLGSTAEEHLQNQGYGSLQLVTLLDLEGKLKTAGKTAPKLQATRAWLDGILAQSIMSSGPQLEWSSAPHTPSEVMAECLSVLF